MDQQFPGITSTALFVGVLEEARFFGIDSLIEHLEVAIKVPCSL